LLFFLKKHSYALAIEKSDELGLQRARRRAASTDGQGMWIEAVGVAPLDARERGLSNGGRMAAGGGRVAAWQWGLIKRLFFFFLTNQPTD
jgi:hypothetical protein